MLDDKIMKDIVKERPDFFQEHFESGLITMADGVLWISGKRFFEEEGKEFIFKVMQILEEEEKEKRKPHLKIVK